MTNLEIIHQLNQLSLQINNLISLLSEQAVIDNDQITVDTTPNNNTLGALFGSEFKEEESLFSEAAIEAPCGEAVINSTTSQQEIIVDDGEELILE